MCDVLKQIFFKNMQGLGIISLYDTRVPLVPPNFVLFQAIFKKLHFRLFQLNRAKWTHFTEQNCSTETAVSKEA